jgi:hypothetical protein
MKKVSKKGRRSSTSIQKKRKKTITTKEIKTVIYDPEKDALWAEKINKMMTRNNFELVDFSPGIVTYEKEYHEVYK